MVTGTPTGKRRLAGKRVIVTGTSPNIGASIARGFADQGALVACTDLVTEHAETCASQIRAAGGTTLAFTGDVTDAENVETTVAAVVSEWGGVDVLVNNAVWIHQRGIFDIAVEDYRRQLDITLVGALLYTRAAARAMIDNARGGSIINILSTAALQGQPGNIGYTTAKSGLLNFTRSAAMELARYDIRVNGFTPTVTRTVDPDAVRLQAGRTNLDEYTNEFASLFPLDRWPTPDDYLGPLVFLAADDSAMMTGSNLIIDGGATAKYWPLVPPRNA